MRTAQPFNRARSLHLSPRRRCANWRGVRLCAKPRVIDSPDPDRRAPTRPSKQQEQCLAMHLVGSGGRYIGEIRANARVVEACLSPPSLFARRRQRVLVPPAFLFSSFDYLESGVDMYSSSKLAALGGAVVAVLFSVQSVSAQGTNATCLSQYSWVRFLAIPVGKLSTFPYS